MVQTRSSAKEIEVEIDEDEESPSLPKALERNTKVCSLALQKRQRRTRVDRIFEDQ